MKERIKFEKFFFFFFLGTLKLLFLDWISIRSCSSMHGGTKFCCLKILAFFFFFRKIEIKRTEGRNSYFLKLILKRSKINSTLFAYFRVYRITFCR